MIEDLKNMKVNGNILREVQVRFNIIITKEQSFQKVKLRYNRKAQEVARTSTVSLGDNLRRFLSFSSLSLNKT